MSPGIFDGESDAPEVWGGPEVRFTSAHRGAAVYGFALARSRPWPWWRCALAWLRHPRSYGGYRRLAAPVLVSTTQTPDAIAVEDLTVELL